MKAGLITGSIMIILGIISILATPFVKYFWIYGGILLIMGIVILFNKEDEIEKIKSSRTLRR